MKSLQWFYKDTRAMNTFWAINSLVQSIVMFIAWHLTGVTTSLWGSGVCFGLMFWFGFNAVTRPAKRTKRKAESPSEYRAGDIEKFMGCDPNFDYPPESNRP